MAVPRAPSAVTISRCEQRTAVNVKTHFRAGPARARDTLTLTHTHTLSKEDDVALVGKCSSDLNAEDFLMYFKLTIAKFNK